MSELIKIKCNCGFEDTVSSKNTPSGTVRIETNYCPECEENHQGGYYEEKYFDKNNNELDVGE